MTALLMVGTVVTDVVARHRGPLAPGTDTAAQTLLLPGGAAANAAAWAARSEFARGGVEVRLLAKVGADSAEWHRASLLAAGVRPQLVVDAERATGVVVCLVDEEAERTFVTDFGAAAELGPADWAPALLDGVGHVHLSGYLFFSPGGRELAAQLLAGPVPVSVDPASTAFITRLGLGAFREAVRGARLVLPNLGEARLLTGTGDPALAAERLSGVHGEAVVTLGAGGAVVAREGRVLGRVPGQRVEAVDSTGAGDAFTGAFLAARLAGADPLEAAELGCAAGALAVTVVGGRPPLGGRAASGGGAARGGGAVVGRQ
ncbi:sugar kinase [Kitasatospora sp. MMS16-BH015]|uniref:carbohydrate kinase family protein n=1 Tax=Kitasatospora sp. MMS16-BH015 TaxID=2018025 RepID=UPI000CA28F2B|nr:PfkB family carbohydrate kinase [Kitasatospora sp. MMS16-BH015]AUG75565.1 sugar kinase [Kitasatospora sp. MMS16-BH015]